MNTGYYASATVAEIVPIEDLVDGAIGKRSKTQKPTDKYPPSVWFLQSAAGSPIDLGRGPGFDKISERAAEPIEDLHHGHTARLKDYWCQCSIASCLKWRIVPYSVYVEKRKALAVFVCAPSCETPHTDEEQAGLDEDGELLIA